MGGNDTHMRSPGVIIQLLKWVYRRSSSNLHVRNDESFQKRQLHLFSVISMMIVNGLNQNLEYSICQVTNF